MSAARPTSTSCVRVSDAYDEDVDTMLRHLDGEYGVRGCIPDVAGSYDVDREAVRDSVGSGDDRVRAALNCADATLEG